VACLAGCVVETKRCHPLIVAGPIKSHREWSAPIDNLVTSTFLPFFNISLKEENLCARECCRRPFGKGSTRKTETHPSSNLTLHFLPSTEIPARRTCTGVLCLPSPSSAIFLVDDFLRKHGTVAEARFRFPPRPQRWTACRDSGTSPRAGSLSGCSLDRCTACECVETWGGLTGALSLPPRFRTMRPQSLKL